MGQVPLSPPPPRAGVRDPAFTAYETLAPFYDRFTADYEYDEWLGQIETWAFRHGLTGKRLLDVACGTGKSFEPLLARGYHVTACDLSPKMVARARLRAPLGARVAVADMRCLPWSSCFDLITCLDDAVNYLLTPSDLSRALRSITAALAPNGIFAFDTNSLATYRTTFAEDFDVEDETLHFRWRGHGKSNFAPGTVTSATVEVRAANEHVESTHLQRHWPVADLRAACIAAGLERVCFRGQIPGGLLTGDPDEVRHTKIVCIAAKPARQ